MTINTEELITLLNYAMAIQRDREDEEFDILSEIMDKLGDIEHLTRKIVPPDDLDPESVVF